MLREARTQEYADESRRLGKLFRDGDRQAGLDLLNLHLPLAYSIAERYSCVDTDRDNTRQNARIGLWVAITRYDPERKNSFSAYAGYWIRNYIIRGLRARGPVRIPNDTRTALNEVNRFRKSYRLRLGTEPSQKTISNELNMSIGELETLQFAERSMSQIGHASLDDPEHRQSHNYSDDWATSRYLEGRALARRILKSSAVLLVLTQTERAVLIARYGLCGQEEIPYRKMGAVYGCSRTAIQHIERMALHKLREHIKRAARNGEEQHP